MLGINSNSRGRNPKTKVLITKSILSIKSTKSFLFISVRGMREILYPEEQPEKTHETGSQNIYEKEDFGHS